MWDFVNKGVSNTSTKRREETATRGGDNLDDLLSGLDDVVSSGRPRASSSRGRDRRDRRSSYETPAKRRRHGDRTSTVKRRRERTPEKEEDEPIDFNRGFKDEDDDIGYDAPEVDFGGDGNDFVMEEVEPNPTTEEEKADHYADERRTGVCHASAG